MPRVKPHYQWTITDGERLKHEPNRKRVSSTRGVKQRRGSKLPSTLPVTSCGQSNVHYGSHVQIEKEIALERVRSGL